ncbi:hypothetical protein Vadar_028705 [Vaccinium darrowii]|uniref:Uncharacterized protein n=1 Tax=Vaccinium darrowii TaxID=229202 RepID=A0ACB7Z0U2_9ERIC|nr:hypothetical protein Vadar_028705 [Vaccinium darrowii]
MTRNIHGANQFQIDTQAAHTNQMSKWGHWDCGDQVMRRMRCTHKAKGLYLWPQPAVSLGSSYGEDEMHPQGKGSIPLASTSGIPQPELKSFQVKGKLIPFPRPLSGPEKIMKVMHEQKRSPRDLGISYSSSGVRSLVMAPVGLGPDGIDLERNLKGNNSRTEEDDLDGMGQNLVGMVHFYPHINALLLGIIQGLQQKFITPTHPHPQTIYTCSVCNCGFGRLFTAVAVHFACYGLEWLTGMGFTQVEQL